MGRQIRKRSKNFSRFSPDYGRQCCYLYGFGFLVQLHGNRVILPSLLKLLPLYCCVRNANKALLTVSANQFYNASAPSLRSPPGIARKKRKTRRFATRFLTPWNTCGRTLHEGNILTLINQETLYIAYLDIHMLLPYYVTLILITNNNLHLALVTLIGNLDLIFMKECNSWWMSTKNKLGFCP